MRVMIGMPLRNRTADIGAVYSQAVWPSQNNVEVVASNRICGLVTYCFNKLWCDALNAQQTQGVTHFAMIHGDVVAGRGWLDVLAVEMEATDADLVSVAIPLRAATGVTSTALEDPDCVWNARRITMRELYELPETFTEADVPWKQTGARLLHNTGLWLCRLGRPWNTQVTFRQQDRIVFNTTTGQYDAQTISEDWDWSRQLHDLGVRMACTRKVGVRHGSDEYHNRSPWGTWEIDEEHRRYVEQTERTSELVA
jgi:hypothetical protein